MKKAIVVMLCVGLVLGILTGCGSKEEAASENTEAAREEKSKEESETTGDEESDAVQDGSTEQTKESDETEVETGTYLIREVAYNVSAGREFERKEYDVNGNVIRISSGYDGDGTLIGWYIYEYDANGNQVKWGQYDEEGAYTGQVYEYDESGNRIREFSVRADIEDTTYETVYQNEYDSDGKLIAREIISSYNGQTSTNREEYEYDDAGNLVRDVTYTSFGEVLTEYDAFGNLTRDQGPSGGGIYEYDEYGNIIKDISLDENGDPLGYSSEYHNEYDASGNLIKCSTYDNEGNLQAYEEYEYDAHGNLIKMTHTMLLGNDEFITIREYEYASF